MYNVQFKVSEQSLVKTGGISTYASDTVEYVKADFVFDDSWDGYDSIKAIWQNGSVKKSSPLNSEGSCTVPAEIVADKGTVKVNLVGTTVTDDVVSKRITTFQINAFTVTVKVNIDADSPQPISPSEYEQFVASVKHDADRAEAGAESAEASASSASDSAEQATLSAQASEASATRASGHASDAKGYAKNASDSADASASSATASANSASQSAQSASDSADSASASAESAREAEEAKETILTMRAVARSLPEGSQATASYENGLLTLGIPKGDKGDTGNGIDHVQLNSDYTLTIFFTDGTQTQTTSIRGEKGETGAVPNFSIGEVTTLDEHEQATASIEGTAEEPILNLGIPQGKTGEVTYEDLESLLPRDTATGNPITITDGQSVVPVKSLEVELEPIQDLNGYDKPWAGGAGKNLVGFVDGTYAIGSVGRSFQVENGEASYLVRTGVTSATLMTESVVTQSFVNRMLGAGTYTFSFESSLSQELVNSAKLNLSNGMIIANGDTFTLTEETTIQSMSSSGTYQYSVGTHTFKMQIEEGSTATSWTPYSNICPISGHTEVVTEVCGVNVWDEEWEVGAISGGSLFASQNTIRSKNFNPCLPNTTYYGKCGDYTNAYYMVIWWYDENHQYISSKWICGRTAISPSNARYFKISTNTSTYVYGTTYNNDISINYPSTDTEYHPYLGDTYTTDLGRTVYGGTLDVVSGEVVVDRAMVDLGSLQNWRKGSQSGCFYVANVTPDYKKPMVKNPICSNYAFDGAGTSSSNYYGANGTFRYYAGTTSVAAEFYFHDDRVQGVSDIAEVIDGVQLVYELATPQTIQLTPQQVMLLTGDNNLWSDGQMTMVYSADVTKWLMKKLNS